MAETEKVVAPSNREKLLAKMAEKYPDRRFSDVPPAEGETPADDLEQAILEYIDGLDEKAAKDKKINDDLVRLLEEDPKMGQFLQKWVESGDPRSALVAQFGDDLADLGTEEGRAKFGDELKGWKDAREKESALQSESEENWKKSLEDLDSWGNSKGLSDEQKSQIILRLVGIAENAILNKYGVEDFDMVLKDTNFDNAVSEARAEGEVAGRNESIKAARRARTATNALPPSMGGGQGMRVAADKPKAKTSPWAGIE